MAGVPMTPEQARTLNANYAQRLRTCVPWSSAMPWTPELNLQASTYTVRELWPGIAASDAPVDQLRPGQFVDSPEGRFRYCVRLQRRGKPLLTWWGNQVGTVIFDGDAMIPALYQAPEDPQNERPWNEAPWMSLTPAELMTLRPGTRMAKGHTVIAGLGLGHQLIEVARRLPVKRVTVVEFDRELADWIMPVIQPHIRKKVDVIIGDAYEVIPKLTANVALIDIFPGYGDGFRRVEELRRASPNIKKIWGWGTSEMTGKAQR